MAFFLVALDLGLFVTQSRRLIFTRYAALGIGLLILIALPNVVCQIRNYWPTLEFLRKGRERGKNTVLDPLQFFLSQFLNMHPLNAYFWIPGVIALVRAKSIANTRWLGITSLFFYILTNIMHAKNYYLAGIYLAFSAGAIAWEHRFATRYAVQQNRILASPVYEARSSSPPSSSFRSPVLRPAAWVAYTSKKHLHTKETETSPTGPLPQFFADRFGWQQETDIVVRISLALT